MNKTKFSLAVSGTGRLQAMFFTDPTPPTFEEVLVGLESLERALNVI